MQTIETNIDTLAPSLAIPSQVITDYSQILESRQIHYKKVTQYLQVGEILQTQGWIIHISVIRSQIVDLLNTILDLLLSEQVPFLIPRDKDTAQNILDGNQGHAKVGKVVTIYPSTVEQAISISKALVQLTENFLGPVILTDAPLGGNVYTRYGSYATATSQIGSNETLIQLPDGQMMLDQYKIPFAMQSGIQWPFGDLASVPKLIDDSILKDKYKILEILKNDSKGNVSKGLYMTRFLLPKNCVIKQGKYQMWSDDQGRDMTTRLDWQYKLINSIGKDLKVAKVIDYFEEKKDKYLVLEYIKGQSLLQFYQSVNKEYQPWPNLPQRVRNKILNYLTALTEITEKLHQSGIIHLDLTPVNFLIDKTDELVMIDLELAHSIQEGHPTPSFDGGSIGFMSPQQINKNTPTSYDDIYSLGATMIMMTTGLYPLTFESMSFEEKCKNLQFLIGSNVLAECISQCSEANPRKRPSLMKVKETLTAEQNKTLLFNSTNNYSDQQLRHIIESAIRGLSTQPTSIHKGLWLSKIKKTDNIDDAQSNSYRPNIALYDGISGILSILARAKKLGYQIEDTMEMCQRGTGYIVDHFTSTGSKSGLYDGNYGIAKSLSVCIEQSIIKSEDSIVDYIASVFRSTSTKLNLAEGLAGQGFALMESRRYFAEGQFRKTLELYLNTILGHNTDKGWVQVMYKKDAMRPYYSLSYGDGGILSFVLESTKYIEPSATIKQLIEKATNQLHYAADLFLTAAEKSGFYELDKVGVIFQEEYFGMLASTVRLFSITHDERLGKIAERLAKIIPEQIVINNIHMEYGLSLLGTLYLEGYKAFGQDIWKKRATHILNVILHLYSTSNTNNLYWVKQDRQPTAGYMTGNSGIIEFLLNFTGLDETRMIVLS